MVRSRAVDIFAWGRSSGGFGTADSSSPPVLRLPTRQHNVHHQAAGRQQQLADATDPSAVRATVYEYVQHHSRPADSCSSLSPHSDSVVCTARRVRRLHRRCAQPHHCTPCSYLHVTLLHAGARQDHRHQDCSVADIADIHTTLCPASHKSTSAAWRRGEGEVWQQKS